MVIFRGLQEGTCQLHRLNRFLVCLVPKCEGVECMDDFRPIFVSNSIYLLIVKVPVIRLS